MVDCNVNQPMINDKEKESTVNMDIILPIASISTTAPNLQISVSQQSPRSSPPVLLDNFKNENTTGSQHNLHVENYNGHGYAKKVHNNSPTTQKKNMVTLTNLPKWPPVDVAFNDIKFSVSEGRRRSGYKTILKGVSGLFRSGELTAIMGPSGSGKSTLCNILAGYRTSNVNGTVFINGKERNLRRFRKLSSYIMQDDCLMPQLSVKEAMLISANLKLGKEMSIEAKKLVVTEILEALGLSESISTRTVDLSGGQRKRLSIALELVNNPPVMFFDEPTSGLDSSSCFQLLSLLQTLAQGGRTIVCTIHQPSARLFEKFDHLYMLAEGQCIYQGRVGGLVPFLASFGYVCPSYHNPADYVMEVASGEYGDAVPTLVMAVNTYKNANAVLLTENEIGIQLQGISSVSKNIANDISKAKNDKAKIRTSISAARTQDDLTYSKHSNVDHTLINLSNNDDSSSQNKVSNEVCTTSLLDSHDSVVTLPNKHTFPTSSWKQFWILLKRAFKTILRDKQLMHMRLAAHVIVGTIIGMIYYDIGGEASKVYDNLGCTFFTMLFTMFTGMMPTILTFPQEMGVFVREHLNYWYSLKAFYFAKTVADMPFQLLFSGVYVITVYYLTSQPMELQRISMFVCICVLTSLVSQSLGLLIGAGLSVESGVFIGPVATIPTILFSGFFVTFDTIPSYLKWLTYVSYSRYGFEGAVLSIYQGRERLKCSQMYCHHRDPKKILDMLYMTDAEYWIDVVALTTIFIGLRIIAYFVLRWKIYSIR
ncbi:ATP-binding cassette sub-family G member 1 isoform X2 [Sitodiplosis mosellana]|uniref:ATP-binding cassette sub-family G member 1 isoform X2 n=1 Tax=Sitodiplosis mosellana TaxID=263140 RepID=UPI0024438F68|nr:ATP-binding cassette sub-family G member 1 isoform X2 [Sitodiplosis mosellana]XP_055299031.1 ATP-binding cassette sub-family G member 1 isoform X2 [Sitodiplosis mosellana]XP_055299032.1 ATP-binding cassette sub-family G member 1 isoform X2 [Sitodiplosis mosellana]XP_055299033.1 ATP-binding cassette sub-family G member 1 isoform X2 [Sitodiplosis mosellana]XP_055299034.1 ATP-binding cassette sub-family G member 1 isoform X2 [Sitodiplosis mosellana]XP_055299035.1 ATP-binding cassette sub-famil